MHNLIYFKKKNANWKFIGFFGRGIFVVDMTYIFLLYNYTKKRRGRCDPQADFW
jgi:hypothetical protein